VKGQGREQRAEVSVMRWQQSDVCWEQAEQGMHMHGSVSNKKHIVRQTQQITAGRSLAAAACSVAAAAAATHCQCRSCHSVHCANLDIGQLVMDGAWEANACITMTLIA
jgi:hypothetical protein